eukprot:TRINITY_DN1627_c1_g1_i1.p2 TRINITY_DN1627_c1_g1~~TRINITY_DN1627_c1_g1_i1.p2  ORF type:complete len:149 (+),score=24.76 TRINITY_DN1627_c1_g1_i1:239-685(+)
MSEVYLQLDATGHSRKSVPVGAKVRDAIGYYLDLPQRRAFTLEDVDTDVCFASAVNGDVALQEDTYTMVVASDDVAGEALQGKFHELEANLKRYQSEVKEVSAKMNVFMRALAWRRTTVTNATTLALPPPVSGVQGAEVPVIQCVAPR